MTNPHAHEKLFSYGTLQYEAVQLSTFGRPLQGIADVLQGYRLSMLEIKDPAVVAASGAAVHPMLIHTGKLSDEVRGLVFEITTQELQQADAYEVTEYQRIRVTLRSGVEVWVYASASA